MMAAITPLTVRSTKSMLQMQRMQPEIKAIQERNKGDREAANAEMMAFYRDNEISPLGGCLPLLAQSPVFIVMYRLLSGLTTRLGGVGSGVGQVVRQTWQGETPTSWVYMRQVFRPEHIHHESRLYEDLAGKTKMPFLGLDLAQTPKNAFAEGFVHFLPYGALLIAILGIQIFQNRQVQARNTSAQTNTQQQMLLKIMPFVLPAFAFPLAAAMSLYWGVQGLCRIATQAYITKKFYRDHKDDPPVAVASTSSKKGSNAKARGTGNPKTTGSTKGSSAPTGRSSAGGQRSGAKSASTKKGKPPRGSGRVSGAGLAPSSGKSAKQLNTRKSGEARDVGQ
jgi:YidC/Oxa1 family membrane protein insertase